MNIKDEYLLIDKLLDKQARFIEFKKSDLLIKWIKKECYYWALYRDDSLLIINSDNKPFEYFIFDCNYWLFETLKESSKYYFDIKYINKDLKYILIQECINKLKELDANNFEDEIELLSIIHELIKND